MPNRISGKLGRVSSDNGANFHTLIFEWTAEWSVEAAECGIKGEAAEQYTIGVFTGRITAQRYATDDPSGGFPPVASQGDSELARLARNQAITSTALVQAGGQPIEFVLEQIAGTNLGTRLTGTGYVTRGGLTTPRQMALDTYEITMNSIPLIITNP